MATIMDDRDNPETGLTKAKGARIAIVNIRVMDADMMARLLAKQSDEAHPTISEKLAAISTNHCLSHPAGIAPDKIEAFRAWTKAKGDKLWITVPVKLKCPVLKMIADRTGQTSESLAVECALWAAESSLMPTEKPRARGYPYPFGALAGSAAAGAAIALTCVALYGAMLFKDSPNDAPRIAREEIMPDARSDANPALTLPSPPLDTVVRMGAASASEQNTLYVFDDPNCPFCQKLEKSLEKLPPEYSVQIFPVPLKPGSAKIVAGISCAKDKIAAWKKGIYQQIAFDGTCQSGRDAERRSLDFFRAFGFNQTPTMISGDGRVKAGFASEREIIDWLAEPPAKIAASAARRGGN